MIATNNRLLLLSNYKYFTVFDSILCLFTFMSAYFASHMQSKNLDEVKAFFI